MRILIYGGCTVDTDLKRDMTALWSGMITRLNRGCDVMLFDTASKIEPDTFVDPGILIRRFDDNPGHLAHGGGDGSGRTFIAGMEAAIAMKYDYVVMWETDMYFAHSAVDVVRRMDKSGVKVACLSSAVYQFPEWAFSVFKVDWLKETKFIERYDWQHAKPIPIPEQKIEYLAGDDLFFLPYYGVRNSTHWLTPDTFGALFPYKAPDWVHENAARDTKVAQMFLQAHGLMQ